MTVGTLYLIVGVLVLDYILHIIIIRKEINSKRVKLRVLHYSR
jgi:hypothetical protein